MSRDAAEAIDGKFPMRQFIILGASTLCRLCEPIAFTSIFPYIYDMTRHISSATNDGDLPFFASLITAAFVGAESLTAFGWGVVSDIVGRKAVLIMGLIGTACSMLGLGFSTKVSTAIIARALGGCLNGNIGVIQTVVGELIATDNHRPRAYSIMPFIWGLGSIIGPVLGGLLAQPCAQYPGLFSRVEVFDRFPFLLPNLVCAFMICLSVIYAASHLQETHPQLKHSGAGRLSLIGARIAALFREHQPPLSCSQAESQALLGDDQDRPVQTNDTRSNGWAASIWCALTTEIRPILALQLITAAHAISFDQNIAILLSSPVLEVSTNLLAPPLGGLGLSAASIGYYFSIQGIYFMFCQLCIYPIVVHRFSALVTLQLTVALWPFLYLLVPFLSLLPGRLQTCGIMVCLIWRSTAQAFSFSNLNILLAIHSTDLTRGTVNGAAASAAGIGRFLGLICTRALDRWGTRHSIGGFPFWIAGVVCFLSTVLVGRIKTVPSGTPDA